MINDIIHKIVDRINLTDAEARHAMEELMATTPLGGPDLGAAWFNLAPDLTAKSLT